MGQLNHIAQPAGSRICGQVAVAVLSGRTLEFVCATVGHKKPTKTRDLVAALKKLGYGCAGSRCIPTRGFFTATQGAFLAQVRGTWICKEKCNWHWVAINDGMVYDGREDRLFTLENYQHLPGRRITSFLPVNISNKFRADEIDIIYGLPNACVQKMDALTYRELPEKLNMCAALHIAPERMVCEIAKTLTHSMQKDGRANQPSTGDITIEMLERLFIETLDTRPFMAGPPRPPGWK